MDKMIRIIRRKLGQKDTGFVPKIRHFGIQFLVMGGAGQVDCMGCLHDMGLSRLVLLGTIDNRN
jgi:hypothetical protein